MKDEEIQQATASEPLTLPEEYAMQQSWRQDADKLTFIACLPLSRDDGEGAGDDSLNEDDDASYRMLGDINLFLRVEEEEIDENENAAPTSSQIIGEIELMIAEKQNHRKGFGRAALLSFLKYVADHEEAIVSEFINGDPIAKGTLSASGSASTTDSETGKSSLKFSCLSAKIGQTNAKSLALFESAHFRKISDEPSYFGEFELRRADLSPRMVDGELSGYGITGYAELTYRKAQ